MSINPSSHTFISILLQLIKELLRPKPCCACLSLLFPLQVGFKQSMWFVVGAAEYTVFVELVFLFVYEEVHLVLDVLIEHIFVAV